MKLPNKEVDDVLKGPCMHTYILISRVSKAERGSRGKRESFHLMG